MVSQNNDVVSQNNDIVLQYNDLVSQNNDVVSQKNDVVSQNNDVVSPNKDGEFQNNVLLKIITNYLQIYLYSLFWLDIHFRCFFEAHENLSHFCI